MTSENRDARVIVKICGITNPKDARDAIECGADALGINLFPGSKRFVELKDASKWIQELPSDVSRIAVMVNPKWDEAINTARSGLFDCLQLHGNETPGFCRRLADAGIRFTKALPIIDDNSLRQTTDFCTKSILLDSRSSEGFGGTGRVFPWSLARRFIESYPEFQVTLAGGLNPENVRDAIAAVNPVGVDVTSGVEAAFGRKDRRLIEAFVAAVRAI